MSRTDAAALHVPPLAVEGLTLRIAAGTAEQREAEALAAAHFGPEAEPAPGARWLLARDGAGRPCGCCRLWLWPAPPARGYSARFHDLAPLAAGGGPLLEIGRLTAQGAGARRLAVLRALTLGLTSAVVASGARVLFGCASLPGADPARHRPALHLLAARHLGPAERRPVPRPGAAFDFTVAFAGAGAPEPGAARALPPLLRAYLGLGAWVGPGAVIDRALDTLHVLTVLEVARVPPDRARALIRAARAAEARARLAA
ncbi:MAG: ornithine-acyl-ACP acyltransferase [Alphaproteobacteria bacterium]|nr:MAG: ornithine-acyl-ACP acyltransferase [Alphaproteobacteria bacterium]